jgi:transcription termination factor Rho
MTDTQEDEPLRAAGELPVEPPLETGAPAKKAPRRKVATRSKLAASATAAEPGEASKPVRSRTPKVVPPAESPVAKAAAAVEPVQGELLPAADPEPATPAREPSFSPDARQAAAESKAEVFGHPGQPESVDTPLAALTPPVPAPIQALDNTVSPAPVVAAGQVSNAPEQVPAAPAPVESRPERAEPPAGSAGSLAAPAEPANSQRDGGAPSQRPNDQPYAPRYPDQQERSGDRGDRRGQERYPRPPQQHGQHQNQRHGQPQQHRPYQPQRGDGQPPQFGGGQRESRDQRESREPRDQRGGGNDGSYGGNQPAQDGGDPLVSRVTEIQYGEGIVEVSGKGFGFLREAKRNFVQTPADVFVTPEVCRKYNLRDGQWIKGEIRRSSRGPQLFRLTALNGEDPEKYLDLPNFEELTTINPNKRIRLETVPERYTTRVMDLMTPIGKGQRGLIVAPPRTGKTTLLQHIGQAVVKNHPEMKLIILLVDERPEEVTELRRTVPQAEMMASSNDSDLKSHTRIAQLAMERAKRLVEANFDVFILLDSITRVGRAFNNAITGGGGRTMSGGIDARAMEIPRKIFAAARNTEEAGSLTIMATALIDTGSKMDEVIFQEFKGTGNMELVLDRKISDQRIYPAVDIFLSGTRREELLLQPWELDKINVIRRGLAGHKPTEAIERLLSFLKKFPTNAQMLTSLPG